MFENRKIYFEALETAKREAFGADQYLGQESFITASEVRSLCEICEISSESSVLDLCCGAGGPALFITSLTACSILGVDRSSGAVDFAQSRAGQLQAKFLQSEVPPCLDRAFQVVTLFETMLAFPDKLSLFQAIHGLLVSSGRLTFTFEEGLPLTLTEQQIMPQSTTVHLTPKAEMLGYLRQAGFTVLHQGNLTESHARVASRLADSYGRHRTKIAEIIGEERVLSLVKGHQLWADWLGSQRSRKFAFVAQRD